MGLGHERRIDIVLDGGLTNRALEQEDLVSKVQRVAVLKVDLKLGRTAFVAQRANIDAVGLAIIVDILNDRIELVGGINAIRLATGFLAARAANRAAPVLPGPPERTSA